MGLGLGLIEGWPKSIRGGVDDAVFLLIFFEQFNDQLLALK